LKELFYLQNPCQLVDDMGKLFSFLQVLCQVYFPWSLELFGLSYLLTLPVNPSDNAEKTCLKMVLIGSLFTPYEFTFSLYKGVILIVTIKP
jgi:hypothetical protein